MIIQSISLLNTISNIWGQLPKNKKKASVSVLIPARDEEERIKKTLRSLSKVDLEMEIIVLDDNSQDSTAEVVRQFMKKDRRIRLIKGKPLPRGWCGKNWACYQLFQKAKLSKKDFVLFLDADVAIDQSTMMQMIAVGADMISVFPQQQHTRLSHHLIDTLPHFMALSFISFPLANRIKEPTYSAAIGQCVMFKKNRYYDFHKKARSKISEDVEIARIAKKMGLDVKVFFGPENLKTIPYKDFNQAAVAFTKNFYSSYPNPASFMVFQTIMFFSFFMPFLLMWVHPYFIISSSLVMIQRFIQSRIVAQSTINTILSPIQIPIWNYIAIRSLFAHYKGTRAWKGRRY